MKPDEFWQIIDSTAETGRLNQMKHVKAIEKALKKLSLDGIASFKSNLNGVLRKACTFKLMVANFVVVSYISDDVFIDFRAWLILLGSKRFAMVVKNPDCLVKLLPRDEVGSVSPCGFVELPLKLYLEEGGDLGDFFKKAGTLRDPDVMMPWPESKAEFAAKYPVLCGAYWNQERIAALHKK
jgi:hypothetical protein